jgi:hypothetical protein
VENQLVLNLVPQDGPEFANGGVLIVSKKMNWTVILEEPGMGITSL